ncbi:MAG: anti-sigma factor family protein [Terriglobales bacterium]
MNCATWQDKIDAFVDSELHADEAIAFEEHLRACPACSQETLARQRLKAETRLAGRRFVPNPEFELRMHQRLGPKRNRLLAWTPIIATAAAVFVLATFLGLSWRQHARGKAAVAQLVDQHVTTLASDHPVDVLSTDSHTVKPWFGGKVPFSVDLPNLAGTQFELIGGRVVYMQQAPAAQIIFAIRKHRISVFMFRDSAAFTANDSAPVRRAGFNTQTWVEDGIRYFAISDVDSQDIRQLCELLKKAS